MKRAKGKAKGKARKLEKHVSFGATTVVLFSPEEPISHTKQFSCPSYAAVSRHLNDGSGSGEPIQLDHDYLSFPPNTAESGTGAKTTEAITITSSSSTAVSLFQHQFSSTLEGSDDEESTAQPLFFSSTESTSPLHSSTGADVCFPSLHATATEAPNEGEAPHQPVHPTLCTAHSSANPATVVGDGSTPSRCLGTEGERCDTETFDDDGTAVGDSSHITDPSPALLTTPQHRRPSSPGAAVPQHCMEKSPTALKLLSDIDELLGATPHTPSSPLSITSSSESGVSRPSSSTSILASRESLSVTRSNTPLQSAGPLPISPLSVSDKTAAEALQCTFCGRGGEDLLVDTGAETMAADPLSAVPLPCLYTKDSVPYHMVCALWCPEVFYNAEERRLIGIPDAIERSREIKCASCRRPGAAIGCACPTCQLSYHLPCAVKAALSLDLENYVLWCPIHTAAPQRSEAGELPELTKAKGKRKRGRSYS